MWGKQRISRPRFGSTTHQDAGDTPLDSEHAPAPAHVQVLRGVVRYIQTASYISTVRFLTPGCRYHTTCKHSEVDDTLGLGESRAKAPLPTGQEQPHAGHLTKRLSTPRDSRNIPAVTLTKCVALETPDTRLRRS